MTAPTLTRLRAAVVGCFLALASCLAAPGSLPEDGRRIALGLPKTLGTWQLVEQAELQASELEILRATDHWRGIYRCPENGHLVVATILSGAGGPLVAHRPEVCYDRQEFCSHSDLRRWTVPQRADRFYFRTLDPRQFKRPALTIAYAWHDGDCWRAPRVPRFQLASHATLQRLQVAMHHPRGRTPQTRAALQQFLQAAVMSEEPGEQNR